MKNFNSKFFKWFIFSIITLVSNIAAQPPSCILQHYSTDNGLSHSGVMYMLEDHLGFMWFGTWDGLNRFDGYKFTNYKSKPGDSNSLSNNRVDFILEDKYGFLWVKTYDNKVHRFDRRTETFQGIDQNKSYANIQFTDIYQTNKGDIWLKAKNNGCFRIITNSKDYTFNVYQYFAGNHDSLNLPNNNVLSIFEDTHNNVWICTEGGLKVISYTSKIKIPDFMRQPNTRVISHAEYNGNIWLGTQDGKLINYGLNSEKFVIEKVITNSPITALCGYSVSSLLIGTENNGFSIYEYEKKSVDSYTNIKYPQLSGNNILSFYIDKYNLIWIETDQPGITRFNIENKTFKHFTLKTDKVSPFVYYGDYYNIFEDTNGFLWINLKGGGFCYYNRKTDNIEYFYNMPGSADRRFSNLVTCALSDSYGNLWLSTHTRGIEKISFIHEKFKHYRPSSDLESLTANEVRAICEDNNGFLWIATKDGKLYCYNKLRQIRKIYSSTTNSTGDICFKGMVYTIMQDNKGSLWLGTKGDGIIKATPVGDKEDLNFRTEHFLHDPKNSYSLSNNWVYTILQDSKNRIWVGTYGGGINFISRKGNKYEFINSNNAFSNYPITVCDKIRHLNEDSKGKIWVGSTNGLIVFNAENKSNDIKFNLYQKEPGNFNSLANNDVHYIHRDKKSQMWVCTFGGGLGKVISDPDNLHSPGIKNFSTANGLPIDIVLSILEDNDGNFWLSTENGLSKFNPSTELFTNYSELEGISKLIFSEATCYKSKAGELFFGAIDGFYSFFPDKIQKENIFPNLVLVDIQLFNKDVKIGEDKSPLKQSITLTNSIQLTYQQSVFSIEYAGLDFRNPDKLEYAFILEGFEKDWNYVRHQRKATYTNLPPGQYTFKVKCTTTGKFDTKVGRELEVIILPPWWKTIWAYICYALVLGILILLTRRIVLEILRLRNKVIIEQKITELKLKFFTNISHELRTPLTLIIGPTEELLKETQQTRKAREYLEIIDKNARRMLRHINQLLDFRKIQTGKMRLKIAEVEIVSFIKDIFLGFKELSELRNVDFKFTPNKSKFNAWIDYEKIDTVVFNLLSNAFKFTPEGKRIELQLNYLENEKAFEIVVADEGTGIAKEDIPFLFERYAVSHKSNSLNSKGTGIGLSLVKEMVELHRGTVKVESETGSGTKFTIRLYLGKAHFNSDYELDDIGKASNTEYLHDFNADDVFVLNETKVDKPVDIKENNNTILIVEDNNDLRSFLASKLSEQFNTFEATDGIDGWNKAILHLPDIIVSDIMMPKMDGLELLNKLRDDFKTSHIPIILLTAKSAVENIIEGFKYGADAYITKPFGIDVLIARINNLLEQRKRLIDKYQNQMKIVELAPDEIIVTSKDEQFLKDVIKTIEENISDPEFNIEKITQNIGLGRTTFFKKIKSLTGFAPVEFMKEIKLKRGYQLLQTGEFTVSEISYKLGFSDAGYFSKCFKEKYNTTPTEILRGKKD